MNDIIVVFQGPSMLAFAQQMPRIAHLNLLWAGMTRAWIPQELLLHPSNLEFDWYWYTSKSLKPHSGRLARFLNAPKLIFTTEDCYNFHEPIMHTHKDKLLLASNKFLEGQQYNGQILCGFAFLMTMIERRLIGNRRIFLLGCDLGATYGVHDTQLHEEKASDYQSVLCKLASEMNHDMHGILSTLRRAEIYNASPESTLTIFPRITHEEMVEMLLA